MLRSLCATSVLSVSLWLMVAYPTHTTETQSTQTLHRDNLVAVHFPDLSQLESDVRNQITTQQNSLAATVKDPSATDAKLSAAYGAMGEIYHAYSLTAPARECYVNANRLAPLDFRWIYLLAKLDQLEGRVDEAIRRFRVVASLQPELAATQVNLGN